jgi:TonB-linked SusC/RagA family outer membrane protein
MRKILLLYFTVFGLLITQSMAAQQKTVTGVVADVNTNDALPGVNVVVKGTTRGSSTDVNGRYSISASQGDILVFTSIGYLQIEATVGSSNQLDVKMTSDVQNLEEVVVTAEFGMKRVARAVGSSAQNIKATEIIESGRENFISSLQGRVAGMTVTSTSGAPGSSNTVILRSVTSISGNNQPLYIIDGIPMNNSTFNPMNQTNSANEYYSVRNLDYTSRGSDLNPEDIESMTVLKGAAAAALYGSDASNGAIIITTKKGTAGKGKISYNNSFRWDDAYGYPEIQQKYANGNYGTTNYYYIAKYGGLYPDGMKLYDNFANVLQTGFTQRHNFAAEGGSDKITLRAAVSTLDQKGVIKTSDYNRFNISLSGRAVINTWLTVESSLSYASTKNNKVPIGTEGPLYRSMLWPIVDDMSEYLDTDGLHMARPDYYLDGDLLNPIFGLYKNKFYDTSDRFLSNVSAMLTPIKNTFLKVQLGWDVGMQTYVTSRHPYYSAYNTGNGYYNITKNNFSDPTMNIIAGYNNSFFNKKLSLSAQFGYHQYENGVTMVGTTGNKFAVPDFQSIINCDPLSISSVQRNTRRRIQAVSAQVELGYNNMAFVTFRARNDWSSTLPPENNSYFYPAVEGSFILTELQFLKGNSYVSFLKLRATIAQVGKDASPLSVDPQLEATALWGGGYRYGFTGPNKNLVPEMNTSKELGFEGRLLKNRVNVDFTYFWTNCEDQIVNGFRLSYGTGFVLNNMNVGAFRTWGYELHIDGDIVKTSTGLVWNVGLNASHTDSMVDYLPKNVSEYYNAYTWNSGNIRNGIQVGYPITTYTGNAYLRNTAGQILISPTSGLPLTSSAWTVIGDREPKLRFGVTTNLSYKNFRFSAMFSGRYKATVVNGTKRLMMQYGTSNESVALRESDPVVFNGVLQDGNENTATPTVNTISVNYGAYATTFTGGDEDWLEKNVNYLRLQELRLSYDIPKKLLARTPLAQASVFFTGNDLAVWTNYSGIDAVGNTVSAAAGGTGGEGMDVWSLPSPRGYSVGLSITFK